LTSLQLGDLHWIAHAVANNSPDLDLHQKFERHIMQAKNTACLKAASKSKDPMVLEIYHKTLPR